MFDTMISKPLIQLLWILLSIGVVISTIVSYNAIWRPDGGDLLGHFLMAAIGLIVVRVLCEGLIVMFMMHENLARSTRVLESMQNSQRNVGVKTSSLQSTPSAASTSVSTPSVQAAPPVIRKPMSSGGWDSAYASTSSTTPDSDLR